MDTILLRDKDQYPDAEILLNALAESYPSFAELMARIADNEFGLVPQWNYYNDGKAWLCKIVYKKKTVFWLSVWKGYFKAAFYFTEKNCQRIEELDIDQRIKREFNSVKPVGRLYPLVMNISQNDQLPDLMKIINFKKNLR